MNQSFRNNVCEKLVNKFDQMRQNKFEKDNFVMHVQSFEKDIYNIKKQLIIKFKQFYQQHEITEEMFFDKNIKHPDKETNELRDKLVSNFEKIYANVDSMTKIEIARHPNRPHGFDFIMGVCDEFYELCGDRVQEDDRAIIGGIAKTGDISFVVVFHEKGRDIESRNEHNFGMGSPSGYRKAMRLMDLACEKGMPFVSFIDTSGAYPGIKAEEGGQGYCLASCLSKSFKMTVPSVAIIIGEGGSGGAISLASANVIMMLENAIYSVISPEGCAAILWKDQKYKKEAACAQKLTAQDLLRQKFIHEIIPEKFGAHNFPITSIYNAKMYLMKHLRRLSKMTPQAIKEDKRASFINMGNL